MISLLDICRNAIRGVISGFDRLVLQGRHQRIGFPAGAQAFFDDRRILYKEAGDWMQEQTKKIVEDVDSLARRACGHKLEPFPTAHTRKEEHAHKRQIELGIDTGVIGAWSSVEDCQTFRIQYAAGRPILVPKRTRCKHLYVYLDHEQYGFMSIRLQTWFPYMVQIALNGREWLARQLMEKEIHFERERNKFLHIDDYRTAQRLLNAQVRKTDWPRALSRLVPIIFPSHDDILGKGHVYSWYAWQSEWATDYIFERPVDLSAVMESAFRHALLTGTTDSIVRYFDKATNRNGLLRQNAALDVKSRLLHFADGVCIRHWINGNSVKAYSAPGNLRIESTINQPKDFKVRRSMGENDEERNADLRKGVVDLHRRACISDDINQRFAASLAVASDATTSIDDILAPYRKRRVIKGRAVRALDAFGKDRDILAAVMDPRLTITGLTNRMIRERLVALPRFKGKSDKQLAQHVSRAIRLLRDHGLLRKYPRQHRYQLNDSGRRLCAAVKAVQIANISQLTDIAA